MPKTALITGISGQDGSYLAELLLDKGYEVHGLTRSAKQGLGCSSHLIEQIAVHRIDRSKSGSMINRLVESLQPDELYHLAADSFVPNGWEHPVENLQSNTGLTIEILEAIRRCSPETRLLNACSREVFGCSDCTFADEETEMRPVTPYGINKASARWMIQAYRDRYGLFGANAILFNHESPRRGELFVTRKVTKRAAEISLGLAEELTLGPLTARRDWGYAGDFVDAMWRMLQYKSPEDFVIGTGITHTVEELVELAFSCVGLPWQQYVNYRPSLARGHEPYLAANATKAQQLLDWNPSISFRSLIEMMVNEDVKACASASHTLARKYA